MKLTPQHCKACKDLHDECGETLWDMYSRKLLLKGWAGKYSPVERRFRAAHIEQNTAMLTRMENARSARQT